MPPFNPHTQTHTSMYLKPRAKSASSKDTRPPYSPGRAVSMSTWCYSFELCYGKQRRNSIFSPTQCVCCWIFGWCFQFWAGFSNTIHRKTGLGDIWPVKNFEFWKSHWLIQVEVMTPPGGEARLTSTQEKWLAPHNNQKVGEICLEVSTITEVRPETPHHPVESMITPPIRIILVIVSVLLLLVFKPEFLFLSRLLSLSVVLCSSHPSSKTISYSNLTYHVWECGRLDTNLTYLYPPFPFFCLSFFDMLITRKPTYPSISGFMCSLSSLFNIIRTSCEWIRSFENGHRLTQTCGYSSVECAPISILCIHTHKHAFPWWR